MFFERSFAQRQYDRYDQLKSRIDTTYRSLFLLIMVYRNSLYDKTFYSAIERNQNLLQNIYNDFEKLKTSINTDSLIGIDDINFQQNVVLNIDRFFGSFAIDAPGVTLNHD